MNVRMRKRIPSSAGGARTKRRRSTTTRTSDSSISRKPILTPRELAVVKLLGSGCSYAQMATRLGISPHTIVSHIKNVYRKLEVHTAAAAVMRAVQLGLLEVLNGEGA